MARSFKYLGSPVAPREDYRFVTGRGRYAADIKLPHMAYAATVGSDVAHAKIKHINAEEAKKVPGVIAVVTGQDIASGVNPIPQYAPVDGISWYPIAVEKVRYTGEWVAVVVAYDRYVAEDAAQLVRVEYEPLPIAGDAESAMKKDAHLVHEETGTNVVWDREFQWGPVEEALAQADAVVSQRFRWNRHSGVPIETTGLVADWNAADQILDVWAAVSMPQFPDILAGCLKLPMNRLRIHYDTDIGGSYGVKRGIKHAVLVGWLALTLKRPVQFWEDRLENMRSGEAHGPDRVFEVDLAATKDGRLTGIKITTIDDEGAYPGRSPAQMGKPVTAIVGPYTIPAVHYHVIGVATNKTSQVAYRGFGQSPTNFVIERAVDMMAQKLGLDRFEIRRRNFIQPDQFPYRIPSGTLYDSGDYPAVLDLAVKTADLSALVEERDRLRREGRLVGIGVATCIEPGGGNALFLSLLNPASQVTTFPEGCTVRIDRQGRLVSSIGIPTAGQSHDTLIAQILAEEFDIPPEEITVTRTDSLNSPPTQSPVGSRMAIMLGGAVHGAAQKIKEKLIAIAAHNLRTPPEQLVYRNRGVESRIVPGVRMEWQDIVRVAYRHYHQMPVGMEPGLQADYIWQVPNGGFLPQADGTVNMYPCYSFGAHIVMVEVSPESGLVTFLKYVVAHDCGTPMNPLVVDGMVMGGVAHGIGAALYEHFIYDDEGQLLTSTFMDYLMPTTMEVPPMTLAEHVTPSPWTTFGQKGTGEGGYMTTPAAVASAVEDALSGRGGINQVPLTPEYLFRLIHDQS